MISGLHDLLIQAMEQSPEAVLITNLSGDIEYVNRKFLLLTGYSKQEVLGRNPRMFASGKTPLETYQDLWKTILAGQEWHGEFWNRKKNGELFWQSISIAPVKDTEGRPAYFMGIWSDSTERKGREEKIEMNLKEFQRQSQTDELTGQYSRRFILAELGREMERSRRYHRNLSGMMIDVDNFKAINDRYGHPTGDRVLKTVSHIIRKCIRHVDYLGRYGGDEFLVILPESNLGISKKVAVRIQNYLEEYQEHVLEKMGKVTVSIGLLSFEKMEEASPAVFIERMDQALLKSKQAGKNTITVAQL